MIARSLLIAGTCLLVLAVGAGCVVAPYPAPYRYDVGVYYYDAPYKHHRHHGGWHGRHHHRHHGNY